MNEQLREINRSLRALDDAHMLGHISKGEYRERRRHLIGTLIDGGGITRRNALNAETVPHVRVPPDAMGKPRRRRGDAVWARLGGFVRMFDVRRWFRRGR